MALPKYLESGRHHGAQTAPTTERRLTLIPKDSEKFNPLASSQTQRFRRTLEMISKKERILFLLAFPESSNGISRSDIVHKVHPNGYKENNSVYYNTQRLIDTTFAPYVEISSNDSKLYTLNADGKILRKAAEI